MIHVVAEYGSCSMLKAVASRYVGDRDELFSSCDENGLTPLERAKKGGKLLNINYLQKKEWRNEDRTYATEPLPDPIQPVAAAAVKEESKEPLPAPIQPVATAQNSNSAAGENNSSFAQAFQMFKNALFFSATTDRKSSSI